MSLSQIVPGVFVVSVPSGYALNFAEFFGAFTESFLTEDDDLSSCSSPQSRPSWMGQISALHPSPKPPTPPITPPWAAPIEESSRSSDSEPVLTAQHEMIGTQSTATGFNHWGAYAAQPSRAMPAGGSAHQTSLRPYYLDPLEGSSAHVDSDKEPYHYLTRRPAYLHSVKGPPVHDDAYYNLRSASGASWVGDASSRAARHHAASVPFITPSGTSQPIIDHGVDFEPSTEATKTRGEQTLSARLCVECLRRVAHPVY